MSIVVLLAPTPPPYGGIAGWTERMLKAELKDGWQVHVVDEKVTGKRDAFGDNAGRSLQSEVKRCLGIWYHLCRELKNKDVKVVHSCIPSFTLSMIREYVCAILTKLFRKKFIIHFRCTVPNTTQGRMGYFMLRRICNIADNIMVLNRQSENCVRDLSKTKTEIIPNFISANEIAESHEIRESVQTALYVGGVIEEKGAGIIIEIAKRFSKIKFRMVGKTDKDIVDRAKGVENVEFVGAKPKAEIKKELKNADIFLFLSFYRGEGFSNALAEAMAAGLPCLVSDWAANTDMIGNSGGIVVPVKNAEEAVAGFEKMLNKDMRKSWSEFNIKKTKTCYSDSVALDMYAQIYSDLVK